MWRWWVKSYAGGGYEGKPLFLLLLVVPAVLANLFGLAALPEVEQTLERRSNQRTADTGVSRYLRPTVGSVTTTTDSLGS